MKLDALKTHVTNSNNEQKSKLDTLIEIVINFVQEESFAKSQILDKMQNTHNEEKTVITEIITNFKHEVRNPL